MFLLTLCLVGTALAAPAAIPEAPFLPAESHVLVSPYISYPDPMLPLRTLDITIEPEPKDENAEIPEPKEEFEEPKEELKELKEEFPELEEPKKELPATSELPKAEKPKPLIVRLELPIKPPSFITNWISSLPNFSFPSFIGNWLHPTVNPTRVLYNPGYYPGYPGAVILQAPKA